MLFVLLYAEIDSVQLVRQYGYKNIMVQSVSREYLPFFSLFFRPTLPPYHMCIEFGIATRSNGMWVCIFALLCKIWYECMVLFKCSKLFAALLGIGWILPSIHLIRHIRFLRRLKRTTLHTDRETLNIWMRHKPPHLQTNKRLVSRFYGIISRIFRASRG